MQDGHALVEHWRARRARWDRAAYGQRPKLPVVVDVAGGYVYCGAWSCYLPPSQSLIMLAIAGAYPSAATHAEIGLTVHGDQSRSKYAVYSLIALLRRRLAAERAPFDVVSGRGEGYRINLEKEQEHDRSGAA